MASRYLVKVPITNDMSSFSTNAKSSPMETVEENALWDYNRSREHDGLPPLSKMPKGTTYTRIED